MMRSVFAPCVCLSVRVCAVCVCSMRVSIRARVCGVCLRAISGGKSETFKSVGSRYKTKPHQVQMQYMQ